MSRVRYIAILSEQPQALAAFYRGTFGLQALGESPAGDVVLGDGAIKLVIFRIRGDLGEARMEPGLHHLGIAVDSLERAKARFRRHNPRGVMVPEPRGPQYGELRFYDPESIPVSLSQRSFGLDEIADARPRFCHVGFDLLDPDAMVDFYGAVFGFNAAPAKPGGERPDRSVGDGAVTLEFHHYFTTRAGHQARYGLNHLGLLVENPGQLAARLSGASVLAAGGGEIYAVRDADGNQLLLLPESRAGGLIERGALASMGEK
jgi:catechol 2,3-dioxygenase-like lactoylglutathione lyase family enzyme